MALSETIPRPDLTVAAWNVKRAFEDPTRAAGVTHTLGDVAIFFEAYDVRYERSARPAIAALRERGYRVEHVRQDKLRRPDKHAILMAVHESLDPDIRPIDLVTRTALDATVTIPITGRTVRVIGHQGNDLRSSYRTADAKALIPHLLGPDGMAVMPTVYTSNNSTRMRSATTLATGALWPLAHAWPLAELTDPDYPPNRLVHSASLLRRLTEMVINSPDRLLEPYGFRDADPTHQPTMFGPLGLPYQMDRFLVTDDIEVPQFGVFEQNTAAESGLYNPASDHLGIAAGITLS